MEELLLALRAYSSAKQAHDDAMFKCEHSWGYRGYAYISALDAAEQRFADALNNLIDARIEERTGA